MNLAELLVDFRACNESEEWLSDNAEKSEYQLWRTCERGDWLLWLAARLNIDRKLIVLAACDCAETALEFVPQGEDRPRIAIETARRWCDGTATVAEVRRAYADADAYAAAYADDAAYAACAAAVAAYAAAAAAYAAYAAYADDAACAAAVAAYAADAYAAYAAYADARQKSLNNSARLVRKRIPWAVWKEAIAKAKGE